MLTASEAHIEKAILNYLGDWCGFFCWKQPSVGVYNKKRKAYMKSPNPYVIKGVSDIIAVTPKGVVIFIEVKSKKGRMSEDQKLFEAKIKDYNGHYLIARSVEDVMDYLNEHSL